MWFTVCRWPQSQEGDWARPPFVQVISIDSCGRRAAGAGAQQQMRAASHRDPTEEDQHRLVPRCVRRQFGNLQNTAPSFSVELCPQFKDFEKFRHCMSSVASIINLVQSAKKSVNIWHGYGQKGGLRRALSSIFSSVLAMRTKCTRQPPSCF